MASVSSSKRFLLISTVMIGVLAIPRASHSIVISELAYNPGSSGSPGDSLEFVEVYNDSPVVVELSGAFFTRGIEFVFPGGTFLKARSAIAVCANLTAMRARFPRANLIGNFSGKLDNRGETVTLVTHTGSFLAEVRYKDRGLWPASADGTGFTLSRVSYLGDANDPFNWSRSGEPGGTPGAENCAPPAIVDQEVFPELGPASAWRYRKGYNEATEQPEDFSGLAGAWRSPTFDDSAWPEGPAPIGFGEPEIATPLTDMGGRYGSFALRKRFQLSQSSHDEMPSLKLSVHVDDAFVAYLNGEEIGRLGFNASGGTEVPFDALANSVRELKSSTPYVLTIQKDKVKVGENVMAIQVHNSRILEPNGDCGFSGGLAYPAQVVHAPVPSQSIVLNEIISRAPATERGIELYNTLPGSVSLDGYTIALGPERAATYVIPEGTSVASRGFLFIPESSLAFTLESKELTVLLVEPDGVTIADAWTLEDSLDFSPRAMSHVRHPDGESSFWISTSPTPRTANKVEVERSLVIHEIHYNPKLLLPTNALDPSPERGEFIELLNRSSQAISLDGYRMTSGFQYDFPPGTMIAAGAYLVIARDPKFLRETYGIGASEVLGPPENASADQLKAFGTLKNDGERVSIEDPLGNTVDEVHYRSEGEWDELADGGGSSLELIDPHQDNGSPNAWQASDERHNAPWTELSYTARYSTSIAPGPAESELHIYLLSAGEMLIDGVSLTQGTPPVEFIPNGDFETNTKPWRLTGTHVRSFRTTEESKFGTASLQVVATGGGDNKVNRIELDTTPALKDGDVKITIWARWLAGSNAVHVCGHSNAFGRTLYLPVPQMAGTPGRENSVRARLRLETGSDNLGPVISKVLHVPAVPGDLEPIHVRARVTDSDGVASVEAFHQKDRATTFESASLHDDGAHDDGDAGDGLYGGEIPGYALRSLVNFYVEAKDSLGRTRTFPRTAPNRTLLFVIDTPIKSVLGRYRLLINNKEMNAPGTGLTRRLLHSDELVRGSLIFEESEVFYDVGIRYRGSSFGRPPDPKMFRVRFNADKPFVDGVKRINISRYGAVQNEGTAYQLLSRAGQLDSHVPFSTRHPYITMKLNTTIHGSAALSEVRPVDSDYIKLNWPNDSDGHAWKLLGKQCWSDQGEMVGGDALYLRTYSSGPYPRDDSSPENYRHYYDTATKSDEDNFQPLIALLKTMDKLTTPDDQYDEAIQQILNVESSLRVFAVRSLLADWDTVDIGNNHNAYLYYAPGEGRHYLVPWDMDHTFERPDIAVVPVPDTFGFPRLIHRPLFKRQYARILQELQESSWSEAYLANWFKLVAETAVPGRVGSASGLYSFIRDRRKLVDSFLRSGINVAFAVTSPNPTGAPGESATLEGTAGIEVAFLLAQVGQNANPVQLSANWIQPPKLQQSAIPTIWQAAVSGLAPGKNEVTIFGFTGNGDLVGSTSLTVYNTTGWAAPTLTHITPELGGTTGGTSLTLLGTGFQPGLRVDIGGQPATEIALVSREEATAMAPPGAQDGVVDVVAGNLDGQSTTLPGAFTYSSTLPFRRGEVDGNGRIDQADATGILLFLFLEGSLRCLDAADVNDDGHVNITDPILLIRHLFQGGEPPPAPYDKPGPDSTADALGCAG